MVEECSEGDSVENGGSGVERGRVATPQVSLPVPYTYVPAQTGGTANGSLVDEKEKTAHRSAHPTNRAVTSQPTAMHHRPTELLKASQLCGQKADQLSCYKPTNRAIKSLAKPSAVPSAGLLSLAKPSAVPSAGLFVKSGQAQRRTKCGTRPKLLQADQECCMRR
jgi:hypothetical protein